MSYSNRFKSIFIPAGLLAVFMFGLGVSSTANAAGLIAECPVGEVNGMSLDEEFGDGTSDITNCLQRRNSVKIVMQLNEYCRDDVPWNECTRPYALGNITNMIKDYEITNGMLPGRDYEIAVVVHSGGGRQMINDSGKNLYAGKVASLINLGVEFYFCQNTTRKYQINGLLGLEATSELVPGVQYVTAGVTAIADFQSRGYRYVQP